MARIYANIFCAIWDDPDFLALSSDGQRTYFMLITQTDITACGSLPLTLRRWSKLVAEQDRETLEPALAELTRTRFVLMDADTEELLVRSFARHDGGYKHALRLKAVIAYAKAIRSLPLRYAVGFELSRLGVETGIQVPPDWDSSATQEAIEFGRSVVTLGGNSPQTTNHKPETTIRIPAETTTDIEPSVSKPTNTQITKPSIDAKFEDFWREYPKRVAKQAAFRKFTSLVKGGVDPDAVIAGARRYAAERRGQDPSYTKSPDGWLHAGRWNDEPARPQPAPTKATDKALGWLTVGDQPQPLTDGRSDDRP